MPVRLTALAAVLLVAGCARPPGAAPNRTAVTYLTRVSPAAALDSVAAWADRADVIGAERAGAALALRDLRPGAANRARVEARDRGDGVTEVVVAAEYEVRPSVPFRDLAAMVYFGQRGRGTNPYVVPVEGSPSCDSEAAWRASDAPREPDTESPTLVGGLSGLQQRLAYPEAARAAGAQGEVIADVDIDAAGGVACVQVISSPHPALTRSALEAVRASTFEPARRAGAPVAVRVTLPVRFALR